MGDDMPMATLSRQVRPLYDCFRQAFAQVTNPPIDPLREDCVMSLATQLGREGNIFARRPGDRATTCSSIRRCCRNASSASCWRCRRTTARTAISNSASTRTGLRAAIEALCAQAEAAAREGVAAADPQRPPPAPRHCRWCMRCSPPARCTSTWCAPACAATVNLIVETGTARDPHHFACLIGFGATAVYPYLAYQTLHDLGRRGILETKAAASRRRSAAATGAGVKKGLLKIISKMGISSIGSYRGAQLFEIVGLDREVIELCFAGTPSRIGGAGFARLEAEAEHLARIGWDNNALPEIGGLLQFVHDGEYHQYNPDVVQSLQRAVATGTGEDWARYADCVNSRPPAALRDLLQLEPRKPTRHRRLTTSKPVEAIVRRFDTAAMSPGRVVAGSARSAGDRDEPARRAQQLRRRRRRPGALRHRQASARSSRSPRAVSA